MASQELLHHLKLLEGGIFVNGTVRARSKFREKVDFSRRCNYLVKIHQVSKRLPAFKKSQWPQFASYPASHLTFSVFLLLHYWALRGISQTAYERDSVGIRVSCLVEGALPGGILPVVFLALQLLSRHITGPLACCSSHSISPGL